MTTMISTRQLAKLASWVAAIVGLLALFGWGVYAAFMDAFDMCGNRIVREYPSPNGRTKLTVFERDCGATTDFSTQASLLRARADLPNHAGNVLAIDTNHGAVAAGEGGGPALGVWWVSDAYLVLYYCEGAKVFSAETRYEGIYIRHERSCPTDQ